MTINLIEPNIELLYAPSKKDVYQLLRTAASNCYQSVQPKNDVELIKKIIRNKHYSVLEHVQISFKVTCDRAVSHEWVRHRIGVAYSQESQRYVAYKKHLDIIKPRWFAAATLEEKDEFINTVIETYTVYNNMISKGLKPEDARTILPNATATRIVVSMNIRAIKHFLKLRLNAKAHPDIKRLAVMLEDMMKAHYSVLF